MSAPCATVGFLLPLVGPWVVRNRRAARTCRKLGPLWRELGYASPRTPLAGPIPWYSPPQVRLTQREAGIQDGLSLVAPWFDAEVRAHARSAASAAGHTDDEAARIGHAAMVAAAVRAVRRGLPVGSRVRPDHFEITAVRTAPLGVSDALRTSPIVAAARDRPVVAPAEDGEKSPT
jgi:hypothetical protein